jgi:hypothetical protein
MMRHAVNMIKLKDAHKILVGKPSGKRKLAILVDGAVTLLVKLASHIQHGWVWIRIICLCFEHSNNPSAFSSKEENFFTDLVTISF